jgi:hypothetical protein
MIILAATASATERCALAELFTSTSCTACPTAHAALDSMVKYDFDTDELAVIRCGLGHFQTPAGNGRKVWYGVQYTPTFYGDGVDTIIGHQGGINPCWAAYKGSISARRAIPSPLEMSLQIDYGAHGDTGFVAVQIVATDTIPYTSLRIRTCIVESGLSYLGRNYNQMLRDYFCPTAPAHAGTPITISLGDTIDHIDEFVVDSSWVPDNCQVVAFVQNGVGVPPPEIEREVIQTIQKPLIEPMPGVVSGLTSIKVNHDLLLEWSPVEADTNGNPLVIDYYQVYRDTLGFFDPGSDPFTITIDTFLLDDTGVIGDSLVNYSYQVTAVAGSKESEPSAAAGEFGRLVINSE